MAENQKEAIVEKTCFMTSDKRLFHTKLGAAYHAAKLEIIKEATKEWGSSYLAETTKQEEFTGRTLYPHCWDDDYGREVTEWKRYPVIRDYEQKKRIRAREILARGE